MRVSLNTIRQFTDINLETDGLVDMINQQLGKVEKRTELGPRYSQAVIVLTVSVTKHENADRLSVCMVDDGGVVSDVPRDENGHVQVVCGAPNVREGMYAVWLPPKSIVPATFEDQDPFVLDARELRGVLSQGMLAAPDELGIGAGHDGILEINPQEWKPSSLDIVPGTSFAAVYGLDDTLIDIENKMFTHRPDLFGQLGVAREIAGIQNISFTSPNWYKAFPDFDRGEGLELNVINDALERAPRFLSVAIKDIKVGPSPLWLQCELVRLGAKPINNIVDATNYVMLLTAQPTHAYDYDKLRSQKLGVRMAAEGEGVTLLNNKQYQLTPNDIVIVDGEGPIGLAGIMGGIGSEVSHTTSNIVLEVATFDMYSLRKSSMRHGIFTDALTRFNKGQSPLQNERVLTLLLSLINDVAGGEQGTEVYGLESGATLPEKISLTPSFINERLGLNLTSNQIHELLENVEFEIEGEDILSVQAPFWRTDIEIREDVVEEIGRLYGFGQLPRILPERSIKAVEKNSRIELKNFVRDTLSAAGANEVLTYSFVHENLMKRAGQNPEHAYRLGNALSPDLQYYRLSLTPSLLDKVHANIKVGHSRFALYEVGKTHFKGEMDMDEPNVPNEDSHVGFVISYADKQKPTGAAYYHAQKYIKQLVFANGVSVVPLVSVDMSADEWAQQLCGPYDPHRAVAYVKDNQVYGVMGEYKESIKKSFKLPDFTAGFELHIDALQDANVQYKPLPRFPKISQDMSLKVTSEAAYTDLYSSVNAVLTDKVDSTMTFSLAPVAIYQPETSSEHKTITLRLTLTSFERTLTENDVSHLLEEAANEAAKSFNAVRV